VRGTALLALPILLALLAQAAAQGEAYIALGAGEGGRAFLAGPVAMEAGGRFRAPLGAVVTAWAEAEERWAFDRWVSDEPSINNSRSNPLVFRVNGSMRLTALFRPLYERVEFVTLRIDSPVPISYPDVVLRGRRVTVSAPPMASYGGRSDMRYVFVAWVLPDGGVAESSTITILMDRDTKLKALYRVEFQFLGEWFRIEEGKALEEGTVELGPGVRGVIRCYRSARLNLTLCPGGRELYVPADIYPEMEPVYERMVRVTVGVYGAEEPVTVMINGEPVAAAPGSVVERWVAENSTVTVIAQERAGDYVLEGESLATLAARQPIHITITYALDPIARFYPPLRPVGAVLLSTPLSGLVTSLQDPLPNLVAAAPIAAIGAAGAVLALRLRRTIERRREAGGAIPPGGASVELESPRQVGYARAVSRTMAIDDGLDPELRELILQRISAQAVGREEPREPARGARRVGIRELLEMISEGSLGGEPVAVSYAELVRAIEGGAVTPEAIGLMRRAGVVVEGAPEPLPVGAAGGGVSAVVGGDGKAYSLASAGARVLSHWSVRPDELPALLPRDRKARQGFRLALSWCDLLEPQEVLEYVGSAASSGVPLIMLFDGEASSLPPSVAVTRLEPPRKSLLAAVALAESVRAGSPLGPEEAGRAAELASRVPGLQFALARSFGASPSDPLSALPRYTQKLGSAAYVASSATRLGWSREELSARVADTLRAYGEVRLLKYREKLLDTLARLVEVAEEWRT